MEGLLKYGVSLTDQMSGPALKASNALVGLTASLKKSKASLAEYQAQLARAKLVGDDAGIQRYTALTELHRAKVYALTHDVGQLKPKVDAAKRSQAEMAEIMGGVATVAGIAAGAVATFSATLVATTLEAAKFGLEQTALKERLITTFDALGDGPEAGRKTVSMLEGLTAPLGQTREELVKWARSYQQLGITDLSDLRGQLTATASAQALVGDSGAEAYTTLTKKIQEAVDTHHGLKLADKALANLANTGVNVSDVATKMGLDAKTLRDQLKTGSVDAAKFGVALQAALVEKGTKPLALLARELPTQMAHARENIGKLFDDLHPEPLRSAVHDLLSELEEGQPIARALKFAISSMLDSLFAVAKPLGTELHLFFLNIEIEALKAYIAAKPLIAQFRDFFGLTDGAGLLRAHLKGIASAIGVIASNALGAFDALSRLLRVANEVMHGNIAGAIVEGMTSGLQKGGGKVKASGEALGDAAGRGITKKLEIQSPSRVTMRLGGHTGMGFAAGLRAHVGTTERVGMRLGMGARDGIHVGAGGRSRIGAGDYTPRRGPALQAGAYAGVGRVAREAPVEARGGAGGKAITIHVGGVHITGSAGQGAAELTETAFALMLERIALQQGLG